MKTFLIVLAVLIFALGEDVAAGSKSNLRTDTLAVNKALVLGSTSTAATGVLHIDHDETAVHGLLITVDGDLAASQYGLYLQSTVAQTNQDGLAFIHQDHASSTTTAVQVTQDGTGHGLQVTGTGTRAGGKNILYAYSNVADGSGKMMLVHSDNASASATNTMLAEDGSGTVLYIDANGTGRGLFVDVDADMSGGAVEIDIANAQTGDPAFELTVDHASTTAKGFEMNYDGTGYAMDLLVNGATSAGNRAIRVYTNANQQEQALVVIQSDNASSDHGAQTNLNDFYNSENAVMTVRSDGSASPIGQHWVLPSTAGIYRTGIVIDPAGGQTAYEEFYYMLGSVSSGNVDTLVFHTAEDNGGRIITCTDNASGNEFVVAEYTFAGRTGGTSDLDLQSLSSGAGSGGVSSADFDQGDDELEIRVVGDSWTQGWVYIWSRNGIGTVEVRQ